MLIYDDKSFQTSVLQLGSNKLFLHMKNVLGKNFNICIRILNPIFTDSGKRSPKQKVAEQKDTTAMPLTEVMIKHDLDNKN